MIRLSAADVDLRRFVRPGDGVVISQGTAEPQTLTEALLRQSKDLAPLDIFLGGGSFSHTFTQNDGGFRFTGYGAVGDHRSLIKSGSMQVIPVHVSALPDLIGK